VYLDIHILLLLHINYNNNLLYFFPFFASENTIISYNRHGFVSYSLLLTRDNYSYQIYIFPTSLLTDESNFLLPLIYTCI